MRDLTIVLDADTKQVGDGTNQGSGLVALHKSVRDVVDALLQVLNVALVPFAQILPRLVQIRKDKLIQAEGVRRLVVLHRIVVVRHHHGLYYTVSEQKKVSKRENGHATARNQGRLCDCFPLCCQGRQKLLRGGTARQGKKWS